VRSMSSGLLATLLIALATFSASSVLAASVERGPYLQQVTPSSVIIRWRTDIATDAVVRYGITTGALNLSAAGNQSGTEHEVLVSGLTPGSAYYYSVGDLAGTLAGGDSSYKFRASPTNVASGSVRIWVIGDSGTANSSARAVRDAYLEFSGDRAADIWLMLGDNAYQDGTDAEYQSAVFDMYPMILRNTPLWPTLGNHDGHSADSNNELGPYFDIFTLPRNGEAGGIASGTEAYYSFDYGNIHFVTLDSYQTDRSVGGAMLTWLENDLATTSQEWLVAFWHHPPYTKGSHDSDIEAGLIDMRERALPILESYGVDLVLSGHSHSYERSYLIDSHYGSSGTFDVSSMLVDGGSGRPDDTGAYNKPVVGNPNQGTVYAVAGSSGQTGSGALDHPVMYISLQTLGSMVLDVGDDQLDAVFIDSGGIRRDYFSIQKGSVDLDNEAPTPVSNLLVNNLSQTSLTLRWQAASDNVGVVGYRIARDGVIQATTKSLSYDDNGLRPGIQYTYTVVALDAAGNQSTLSSVSVTTLTSGGNARGSGGGGTAGLIDLLVLSTLLVMLQLLPRQRVNILACLFLLFYLPSLALAHEDIDEQLAAVNLTLVETPDDYALLARRGKLHSQHGDWQLAVRDLRRAQGLAPDGAAAALDLDIGLAFHLGDKANEALSFIERYLVAHPDSSAAWRERARIQMSLNRKNAALEDFSRAIRLSEVPTPEHYIERARVLEHNTDRFEELLAGIDDGIDALGPLASLVEFAINIELERGNYAAALDRTGSLPEPIRRQSRWLYNQSQMLLMMGRQTEAESINREALRAIERLPASRRSNAAYDALRLEIDAAYAAMTAHIPRGNDEEF